MFIVSIKDMVRLDWVSTEDGSHILTVGVAANIYLYTQISQDPAQQNVALMKESETSLRRPFLRKASSLVSANNPTNSRLVCFTSLSITRWICSRMLELHSVDGLPPVPTTISWARDGLLIVGMQSEMRVYNQWNLQRKQEEESIKRCGTNPQILTLALSQSHSMLDHFQKKKDIPTNKSRIFIDLMNKLKRKIAVNKSLSRAASMRRMSTVDSIDESGTDQLRSINFEEDSPDYDEIDDIAPLPLYALFSADSESANKMGEKAEAFGGSDEPGYDSLFTSSKLDDVDLDEMLNDSDSLGNRSRNLSGTSEIGKSEGTVSIIFTAAHNRSYIIGIAIFLVLHLFKFKSKKYYIFQLAKAAFQQNQDPMDASLFYLALKKKNVLTHLFKVRITGVVQYARKSYFYMYICLNDISYICLYRQIEINKWPISSCKILVRIIGRSEVLGQSPDEFEILRGKVDDDSTLGHGASRDPFERSMTYWLLKDYARAAHTLVEEAHRDRDNMRTSLSDIFNFYSFLRKHPLVVRQRLADAGAQVGSTEKFLAVGKQLETLITPPERRYIFFYFLFFRTAAEHMAHGCPMLALDVLSRLPKNICMVKDGSLKTLLNGEVYI
uniref:Rav1p_C domain-containing protein n=1 Tax=Heterorhabditis bacteriophora TaxID=37862 RepID=A0A1I7WD58_HETBA